MLLGLRGLIFSAALVLGMPGHADTPLKKAIDGDHAHLEALYTHLHQNPELSFLAYETAKRISAERSGFGYFGQKR